MSILYRVIAPRRSGHHAVIQWLLGQYQANEYTTTHTNDVPVSFFERMALGIPDDVGRSTKKDVLLGNVEDVLPHDVTPLPKVVQQIWDCRQFLVLRDPYNFLASRFRWRQKHGTAGMVAGPMLYLAVAYEFLRRTQYLPDANLTLVNYNQWLTEVAYRQQLATEQGLTWNAEADAEALQRLALGGSSFADANTKNGETPSISDLLNRWRQFADNKEYRKLVEDPRLAQLSQEIFHFQPEWPL